MFSIDVPFHCVNKITPRKERKKTQSDDSQLTRVPDDLALKTFFRCPLIRVQNSDAYNTMNFTDKCHKRHSNKRTRYQLRTQFMLV